MVSIWLCITLVVLAYFVGQFTAGLKKKTKCNVIPFEVLKGGLSEEADYKHIKF